MIRLFSWSSLNGNVKLGMMGAVRFVLDFLCMRMCCRKGGYKAKNKLHGLSPRANYTDRATAACQRSDCQRLRIKGATLSA
jgi:hypothetical protein